MLKVYIGPNGFGKTFAIKEEISKLKENNDDKKDFILLNSEIVFADEMKDTINDSFVMDYLIQELLDNDEISTARKAYENAVNKSIMANQQDYNEVMEKILLYNNHTRNKNVIDVTSNKEYKKIIKINSDDLKKYMGSGQKLQFLLRLIEKSTKRKIYLDEPENHTHPSLLHITAGLINKISENKEVCVVTHSADLLNYLNVSFENIYIFNDPNFNGPKKINFEKSIIVPDKIHIENINSKSRTYYNIETLKENIYELHKKEFFEALFSKFVFIVEGVNDEIFLKKLLHHYNKQFSLYSIFHCYGKPHFLPFINMFKDLDIKVIPIFDKDNKGENDNAINDEIKKCEIYLEFENNLEDELGYKGSKSDTPAFIEFLDKFNSYDKYKYIVDWMIDDV